MLSHKKCIFLNDPYIFAIGPPSFQAVGTIDGKFDCGYLVSVKLGNETLNGVLYHPGYPGSSAMAHPTCLTPHCFIISQVVGQEEEGQAIQAAPNPTGVAIISFSRKNIRCSNLCTQIERGSSQK